MNDHQTHECLAALIDAAAGAGAAFHAAAGEVRSEEARALLLDRADRYGRAAAGLRSRAASGGPDTARAGDADSGLPPIGASDEARILAECERRECAVVVAFRDALEQKLPPDLRAVVAREFEPLLFGLGSLRVVAERAARQRRHVAGRADELVRSV